MSGPANSLNMVETGFQSFNGVSVFRGRTLTAGTGITISNGTGVAGDPTITASGSVPLSFNGDTGTATPALNTLNVKSTASAGSSTSFSGSGSTLSFNTTDAFFNTLIGASAGNALLSTANARNTGLGSNALQNLTTGFFNIGIGYFALNACTSGSNNVGIGNSALGGVVGQTFTDNTAVGFNAGSSLRSAGINNTIVGSGALASVTTGTDNIAIGYRAGLNLDTNDSNNIVIGNEGNIGPQNGLIKIGTTGIQNECYIAGIAGVTNSNNTLVTQNSSTGQLGATTAQFPNTAGTSGNVLTSDGTNWTSATAPGGGVLTATGTLTSAQIKALNASPVTVLAAPGAGRFYRMLWWTGKFTYGGSNVFVAGVGQTINVYLGTTLNQGSIIPNAEIVGTTTVYTWANGFASTIATTAENQPLNLYNSNATEISGNAANDNTVSYSITYQIMNI